MENKVFYLFYFFYFCMYPVAVVPVVTKAFILNCVDIIEPVLCA